MILSDVINCGRISLVKITYKRVVLAASITQLDDCAFSFFHGTTIYNLAFNVILSVKPVASKKLHFFVWMCFLRVSRMIWVTSWPVPFSLGTFFSLHFFSSELDRKLIANIKESLSVHFTLVLGGRISKQ